MQRRAEGKWQAAELQLSLYMYYNQIPIYFHRVNRAVFLLTPFLTHAQLPTHPLIYSYAQTRHITQTQHGTARAGHMQHRAEGKRQHVIRLG